MAVHHPGTTNQQGSDAGKLSTPAHVPCSVSPARHRSSADTKIRLLSRIEFGYHGPEPVIAVASLTPAATHHNSQAETDPHIQQKSPICAAMSGGHCNASASLSDGLIHLRVCRGLVLSE